MLYFRYARVNNCAENLIFVSMLAPAISVSNRDGPCRIICTEVEAQMFSTESPPLNDVLKLDFDDEYAQSNRGDRLKPGYRSPGFTNAQFKSGKPSIGGRLTRSLARLSLAVLIGVGATLAWQSWRRGSQNLGSIAELVVARIDHGAARPGCNFDRITAAA
jgi:hypothetical protein